MQANIAKNLADIEKLNGEAAIAEKKYNTLEATCEKMIAGVGNIVHDSVPVSDNEDNNVIHRVIGQKRAQEGLLHHHEVLHRLHIAELERGAGIAGNDKLCFVCANIDIPLTLALIVSGHRAYFLRGLGVRLNQALIKSYDTTNISSLI